MNQRELDARKRLTEATKKMNAETQKLRDNPWESILPFRRAQSEFDRAMADYVTLLRGEYRARD